MKLIQSYIQDKYFVSTIYRQSSAVLAGEIWYYETLVWEWDSETKDRGVLLDSADSGHSMDAALESHASICKGLVTTDVCSRCETDSEFRQKRSKSNAICEVCIKTRSYER